MNKHLIEESTDENIECFYLFLDTNLFYSPKVTYNVFKIKLMTDILAIRDSFNNMFNGYRKIKILIPKLVVDEIYSIKAHIIQSEISKFQKTTKYLIDDSLHNSLKNIYSNVHSKLDSNGERFFSRYDIEIVPYCDNNYFPAIIEKSINKCLPFKPYFDQGKERYVGDNGFKDTVIWYSIINHVGKNCNQDTSHIFFLTNNEKDFKSESTLLEFNEATGIDIEIIKFKSPHPNVNDNEFNPFLNIVLNKSHVPIPVKLEHVYIFYLVINNDVEITSIVAEPLSINIGSVVNFNKVISNLDNDNQLILNKKIKETLSDFRFDVSDLTYHYQIPEIVHVSFALFQSMFDVTVDDILLTYTDGSEKIVFCSKLVYETREEFYEPWLFKENYEQFVDDALVFVYTYLEECGYGDVPDGEVDFEYIEDLDL